jgi:hypothetical protein
MKSGDRVGPYLVAAKLGEGGMGEVYRATDSRLKRDVALKVLPANVASDPDRLARFQREAEVLASLNHPHIAQVHGLEISGDITALVLELIDGDDLSQLLTMRGGFRSPRRSASPSRLRPRSRPRTIRALSIATSSRRTSRCGRTAPSRSSTSGWPSLESRGSHDHGHFIRGSHHRDTRVNESRQARGEATGRETDIWAFGLVLPRNAHGRVALPPPELRRHARPGADLVNR